MLVRIDKDWTYPDIRRQTPAGDGVWGDIRFTTEPVEDCDLLIVLNGPSRDIRVRCPAGCKWLFTQESPVEQYRWHTDSFVHFDKLFTFWEAEAGAKLVREQTGLCWQIGKTLNELKAIRREDAVAAKTKSVSWVTSNATHKSGHKLRMSFLSHLKEQRFEFDLFGRGFTPIADKFDGVYPYRYSIGIENYACTDYWTEKIVDCYLSWTLPIYWGCTNILSYFPERSMLLIDPTDPARALAQIQDALASDYYSRNLDALAEARQLVLDRYQFFPHVQRLIAEHGVSAGAPRQKYQIPANPQYYADEGAFARKARAVKRGVRSMVWTIR